MILWMFKFVGFVFEIICKMLYILSWLSKNCLIMFEEEWCEYVGSFLFNDINWIDIWDKDFLKCFDGFI